MKLLDTRFNRHGHTYEQLKRTGKIAMYAVKSEHGGTLGFEVVRIRVAPACFLKLTKSHVPERERYPGDEDFGTWGWYFPYELKGYAEAKYLRLLNETA